MASTRKDDTDLPAEKQDSGDPSGKDASGKSRLSRLLTFVFLGTALAALAFVLISSLLTPSPQKLDLSAALALVDDSVVASATLDDNTRTLTLTKDDSQVVSAEYPDGYAATLTDKLLAAQVPVTATAPSRPTLLTTALLSMLPVLVIVAALVWLMRSGGFGSLGGLGKRGQAIGEVPATRFADVAGADEAVEELAEMVEYLKDPSRFTAVGATPPKGALLVGPPGTGKTLLARAVAGESEATFYEVSASDFVEIFAGAGARKVRELFEKAEKDPRAIIFIDEVDAVGRARSGSSFASDSEREQTLVQLLTALDGFKSRTTLVLAATNRPEVLDPALTRPGRLDRQIHVPLPDRGGRERILMVHSEGRPVGHDVDFTMLARRTPGFSGAELARLVNEASMEAARRGVEVIDSGCFDSALAIVALGRARTSAIVTDRDREITAWHESGHALVALLTPADDPVHVSITPRGPAGGVTWMGGSDDVFLTRSKAYARLQVALAGRAAEMILLDGDFTTGAHGDLTSATELARAMVTTYGMTGSLVVRNEQAVATGAQVGEDVDAVCNTLLDTALQTSLEILRSHHAVLAAVSSALLVDEDLSGAQVASLHEQLCGCAGFTGQPLPVLS